MYLQTRWRFRIFSAFSVWVKCSYWFWSKVQNTEDLNSEIHRIVQTDLKIDSQSTTNSLIKGGFLTDLLRIWWEILSGIRSSNVDYFMDDKERVFGGVSEIILFCFCSTLIFCSYSASFDKGVDSNLKVAKV